MIDFHCHVDLFPDPVAIIRASEAEGIYVLAVTTTPKSWVHLQTLLEGHNRIKGAVGLHPELVAERSAEVEEVCSIMTTTRYVGEIGLDGSPDLRSSFNLQVRVFERILARATELGGRILSIHSRRAASPVLDALERKLLAGSPVLHWFSGSKKELDRAIGMGCWFSVGPAMLNSAKGRGLLAAMPREKVLTESDGPFARLGARMVSPNDVARAEECLANIWSMPVSKVKVALRENLQRLVSDRG